MATTSMLRLAALAVFSVSISLAASAQSFVVAPNDLASVEGNAALPYPFNIGFLGLTSQRYQQVYAASQFAGLPAGGSLITQISFRVNGTLTSFSNTLSDIQFSLSTTPKPVDGLSLAFAENVGADNQIVYGRAPLSLSGTGGPGPNPFNVTVALTTPFFYNPARGNLLLDVNNYGGGVTAQFDATSQFGDAAARVFTDVSGVSSSLADRSAASFLITRFTVEVPEPCTAALGLLGAAALRSAWRRRTPGR